MIKTSKSLPMRNCRLKFRAILILVIGFTVLNAQQVVTTSGGNASGPGGTVSYTVGQVTFNTVSGINGTLAQGVQQPFEISVVTSIKNTEEISLDCIVYPNPTNGISKLVFKSPDYENMRFRLYDINGVLLQDKKVEDKETEISVENLSTSIYFLKVLKNNHEVKVFKIIKR
jgi:hypothetical protein